MLLSAALAGAGAGYFAATAPQPPPPIDLSAREEAVEQGVESMTPAQLWKLFTDVYEPRARHGMQRIEAPADTALKAAITQSRLYRNSLGYSAAGLAVLGLLSLAVLPK